MNILDLDLGQMQEEENTQFALRYTVVSELKNFADDHYGAVKLD